MTRPNKARFRFGQVVGFKVFPFRFGKVRGHIYEFGCHSYEVLCQGVHGTDQSWWAEGDLRPMTKRERELKQ